MMLAHGKVRGRVGLRGAGLRARGRTGSLGAQTRTAARVLGETLSCLRTAEPPEAGHPRREAAAMPE